MNSTDKNINIISNEFSMKVKAMFDQIAPTYDFLNHFLSVGFDIIWRKKFIGYIFKIMRAGRIYCGPAAGICRNAGTNAETNTDDLQTPGSVKIADIAAGTGDLTLEAIRYICRRLENQGWLIKLANKLMNIDSPGYDKKPDIEFYASDISYEMLKKAKVKINEYEKLNKKLSVNGRTGIKVNYVVCDIARPCFKKNSFDIVMSGFGLRNFPDASDFALKSNIMLKKNGINAILEFTNFSDNKLFLALKIYYENFVKLAGNFFSGHIFAYNYLVNSIFAFKSDCQVKDIFEKSGYALVFYRKLFPPVTSIYYFKKITDK
ncbi:MAG: class I SAM-dependent methyltransferase [Candidatus Wallbacteria bacterium]